MAVSSILTALCILGSVLNAKRRISCLYVWAVCNVGWGVVDVAEGNYPRAFLDLVQLAIGVYGIAEWRRR